MTAPLAAPVSAAAAAPAPAPALSPQVREAAREFEGVLMSMLVEEMMKGSGLSDANPVYAGMVNEQLGDQLAAGGGIGLAAMLERQLEARS
jgi:peptidoglycan hydrolase FlgJ